MYGNKLPFLSPLNQFNIPIVLEQVHRLTECALYGSFYAVLFSLSGWGHPVYHQFNSTQGLIMHLHRHWKCTHMHIAHSLTYTLIQYRNAQYYATMSYHTINGIATWSYCFFFLHNMHSLILSISHLTTLIHHTICIFPIVYGAAKRWVSSLHSHHTLQKQ